VSVTIRRATAADLDFIAALYANEDVRPWLAAGGRYDREGVLAELERHELDPPSGGLMLIEVDGERAGVSAWERINTRSRIAHLGGLAIHPDFRGRKISDDAARLLQRELILELGFHRLELEVYAFNERAQRHAERAGFVREGVKRRAYRRGDGWVDSVCYALIAEDLSARGGSAPRAPEAPASS
jgi:RimJ/RimL family protein N-acetyltransferase